MHSSGRISLVATPKHGEPLLDSRIVHTCLPVVQMREPSTQGFAWVYASFGSYPSLDAYDYADTSTASGFHQVQLSNPTPDTDVPMVIDVYGSPFAVQGQPVPYDLGAWYPPQP